MTDSAKASLETNRVQASEELVAMRRQVLAFIRAKVGDPDLAEDILQDSLLKALQSDATLREGDKIVPWFYRIVRNAIIDAYRRSDARTRRADRYALHLESEESLSGDDEEALCECFRVLIPALKDEYREVIEEIDLAGADPDEMARRIGVTRNNLKVRLHRARQRLRAHLEETCRTCARHGCLDCTCRTHEGHRH